MTPLTFTALLAVVVLFIFFLIGAHHARRIDGYDSFYLRKRNLRSGEYASSFAASSTSLATVLIWFVTFSPSEGLPLLYAPLTYLLGAILFSFLVPVLERHNFFREGRTLGAYVHELYASRQVAISISLIASIGLLCVLLIELYVGATIFSVYVSSDFSYAVPVAVALVALTVFCYSALGGFPGVVRSDKFQLVLILALAILGPLILWLFPPTPAKIGITHLFPRDLFEFSPNLFTDSRFIISLPLFVNLLFVNVLYYPAQLRSWQMAAACDSATTMRTGLIRGGILNTLLWFLFIAFGILIGAHYPDAGTDFNQILKRLAAEPFILSYVLFPLLFVAALAALVSTADSAIIPLAQTFADDYAPARWRTVVASRLIILALLLFAMVLYYVVFVALGYGFFDLLFTLFGLLIILAPSILFAMFFPERAKTRRGRSVALLSIWVGFAATLFLSTTAKELAGVLYAGPIGVCISGGTMLLGFARGADSDRRGE